MSRQATLRGEVVRTCRELTLRGLSPGTSGNVSVRLDAQYFLLTPTGMSYESLTPQDVALLDLEGRWFGSCRPSSEWRMHRDIYRARAEVGAIVHTHSRHATGLACAGRGIPAFHYMVAACGGLDVRCAPYATFGTQALSDAALTALADRRACLLANHGVVALGDRPSAALALAAEVETLAAQYIAALAAGPVRLLDEPEMRRVLEKFRSYGQQQTQSDPELLFGGPHPEGAAGKP